MALKTTLPLTTTFVPPASCWDSNVDTAAGADIAADEESNASDAPSSTVWTVGPTTSAPECYPSGYTSASFYSPGLCPNGYYIGLNSTLDIGTLTETRASCCPTLFNANPTDVGARCSGYLYDGDDFAGTIYANAVSIRWQSTDFTTPTMTSTTIKPKTSSIARNTSTQSPEAPLESHGLTIGAKAGIGVGVSLGVILTIGLALWLFYARRKRSQSPPQGHDEPDHMTENVVIYETLPVELPTPTYFTTELPTPRSGSPPSKPAELASS